MKHILSGTLLLALAISTTTLAETYTVTAKSGEGHESYQADMITGDLTISWGSKTKLIADMVGYAGQTTRALVSFNGNPALTYENPGANTHFEVFYTLAMRNDAPVIDCAYFNIRNGLNGVSIRKATCNLNKPLSNKNQDLISTYSDRWLDASNTVSLQSVLTEPSKPAEAPVGRLGEVEIVLRYGSVGELMSATPKTIAIAGSKIHEVSSGNAYLVYDADATTPMALDVETNPITHELQRLTPAELSSVVEAFGNGGKK